MGRNWGITKIVISLTSERIFNNPFGFWKRDERATFLSISFFLFFEKRCGRRGRLWVFLIFHEFQSQLSRERKKIKIRTLFRWNRLSILNRIALVRIFKISFRITISGKKGYFGTVQLEIAY